MSESNPADRLPPGQNLTRDVPVVQVGSVPHFDPQTWSLRLYGLVESPIEIGHASFLELPRVSRTADLHCVATWTAYDLQWEGVPLRTLVNRVRPLPEAHHVLVHADGGYSTNVTLEEILVGDVLIADRLNGEALPPEHGFPARLVIPGKYAYKCAKWVRGLEFLSEERRGFWESRGYSNSADALTEDRFEAPTAE